MKVLSNKVKFIGAYLCQHFSLIKQKGSSQKSCCKDDNDYILSCSLNNQICCGIVNCQKISLQKKIELIEKWKKDLDSSKNIDVNDYIN